MKLMQFDANRALMAQVWVSCHKARGSSSVQYILWAKEPRWEEDYQSWAGSDIIQASSEPFFGVAMQHGEKLCTNAYITKCADTTDPLSTLAEFRGNIDSNETNAFPKPGCRCTSCTEKRSL